MSSETGEDLEAQTEWTMRAGCSTFQTEIAGGEPALQDLARGGADHATKRTREVGRIGEPSCVGRVRDGLAARQLTGATLQTQPEDIRAQGNANRCREEVQKSGWRQADACGEYLQRDGLGFRQPARQIPQDTLDAVIDRRWSTIGEQCTGHPGLHASRCQRRRITQLPAPCADRRNWDRGDVSGGAFSQRRTQFAFRVHEGNQHGGASRVDFVPRVRSHEHSLAPPPALTGPLAEPEGSVECHDELHAVMPVQVGPRTRTPQEQRRRPCKC